MATKARKTAKRAKKRAAGKTVAKKPAAKKATRRAAPPSDEPLTLEEAQAIARSARPARTVRRAVAKAAPTDAAVAKEQHALESERDRERKRRETEYRDVMKLLERNGVRKSAPAAKGRRKAVRRAPAVANPLRIMAEGDSWFEYPVPFFGGGIIPRLEKRLGVPILNLAGAGDEVRFMLGVAQRKRLVRAFQEGSPAGGAWDVVLFSGGGNDITDNPMALWIRDYVLAQPPAKLIHQQRFDAALAMVRAGYEDLITLRNQLSPNTHLVFHGYDFAFPSGKGICGKGPWLKPTFDLRGFPTTNTDAFHVVKTMLQQFLAMLNSVAAAANVSVVATQGTLAPQLASWHNELHPSDAGFDKIAEKFQQHLKQKFAGRVP